MSFRIRWKRYHTGVMLQWTILCCRLKARSSTFLDFISLITSISRLEFKVKIYHFWISIFISNHFIMRFTTFHSEIFRWTSRFFNVDSEISHVDSEISHVDSEISYVDSEISYVDSEISYVDSEISYVDFAIFRLVK